MNKTRNYMRVDFPSMAENEETARIAAAGFLAHMNPTLDDLSDIKTSVGEAVCNAILYAYPVDEPGRIMLRMEVLDGGIVEITVRDWGAGIKDVEQARHPLYTTGGDRSGMGFTIMESLMDSVEVTSCVAGVKPEKGTTVTMRKRIA